MKTLFHQKSFSLSFLLCLIIANSFSQSKKEQIELLNIRVDSLKYVLSAERVEKSQEISSLDNTINQLTSKVSSLEEQISSLNGKVNKLTSDLIKSREEIVSKLKELGIKQEEINNLQNLLKSKKDSLDLVNSELEKLIPVPNPLLVYNSNPYSSANSNISNQVSQTGTYKSVKIGKQTWMVKNLNVDRFRNGDPIPQAKTNEEWEKAGNTGKPAWCYYENDPKNGTNFGKLYNWFAVNDPRGLAPLGYHVPMEDEWTELTENLGEEEMKNSSGWPNTVDTKVYEHNSTGFSGLPGGYRFSDGTFNEVGYYGYWWSSTENRSDDAHSRGMNYVGDSLTDQGGLKDFGFSVRCLMD
jgi:uncharacterized protein (TIGR02145 family)